MVNSYKNRFAFSLIELIFAIVVIGITVVSIPIMTNATNQGVDNNLLQEAVFGASAQINQVLSYRWDENSIDESVDANATGLAKVINRTGTGSCESDKLKPGHIAQPLHRRCLDNNDTRASAIGGDGAEIIRDDIDDFNGVSEKLFIGNSSGDAYKQDYNYTIAVQYTDMNGTIPNTDVAKRVTVTISDAGGGTMTNLSSYTFNIGEVDYYKRMYP